MTLPAFLRSPEAVDIIAAEIEPFAFEGDRLRFPTLDNTRTRARNNARRIIERLLRECDEPD